MWHRKPCINDTPHFFLHSASQFRQNYEPGGGRLIRKFTYYSSVASFPVGAKNVVRMGDERTERVSLCAAMAFEGTEGRSERRSFPLPQTKPPAAADPACVAARASERATERERERGARESLKLQCGQRASEGERGYSCRSAAQRARTISRYLSLR